MVQLIISSTSYNARCFERTQTQSCQFCQFCPLVPQETFLDSGGFLKFTAIICWPDEAFAMNLPQLCWLHEATTIKLPQVPLNNEVSPNRPPQYGYYLGNLKKMSSLCLSLYSVGSSLTKTGSSSMHELLETNGNSALVH